MPDLVIGARKTNFPRPWRAGLIAIAMVGVALVVAWFIYRRSVAYEFPGGVTQGEITESQVAPGARPLLAYNGSTLEWEKTLMRQGFKFVNPNEKSNCGCGTSFTV